MTDRTDQRDDHLRLIEADYGWRDELLGYVNEFAEVEELYWQGTRKRVEVDYDGWVKEVRNHSRGVGLAPDRVPATLYWLVRGRRILGTLRLRHELNARLRIEGGHIGYDVRPSERRKGYATRMLAMALEVCRRLGYRRVLVTCNEENVASEKVIRANGGVYDGKDPSPETGKLVKRFWIALDGGEGAAT